MDASQHGELVDWLDRLFNRDDVEPRDHHVADIAPDDAAEIEVDEEPAKFIVDEPKAPMRVVRYLNWAADYPAAEPLLDQPPWPTLQANRPRGPIPRDGFVSEQVAPSDEFDPGVDLDTTSSRQEINPLPLDGNNRGD